MRTNLNQSIYYENYYYFIYTCCSCKCFFFSAEGQISLGVKGGYGASHLYTDLHYELQADDKSYLWYKYEMGSHFGLLFNYSISKKFSLQTELNHSAQGDWKVLIVDTDYGKFTNSYNTSLNYLNIPFLAKVRFGGEKFGFFINGGPYIGYALNGKSRTRYSGFGFGKTFSEKTESDIDFKEDGIKRFDFGVAFGTGVIFKVGRGDIFVEGRIGYGLVDISDKNRGV